MIGNKTGKLGEDIAEKYLINKGFRILHKNYWKPYGEIDIICEKNGVTHFLEVKSVSSVTNSRVSCLPVSSSGGSRSGENIRPEDNVHGAKLKKLARVIEVYISAFHARLPKTGRSGHGGQVKSWQFDVMIIHIDQVAKRAKVRVLENQILEARN